MRALFSVWKSENDASAQPCSSVVPRLLIPTAAKYGRDGSNCKVGATAGTGKEDWENTMRAQIENMHLAEHSCLTGRAGHLGFAVLRWSSESYTKAILTT